MCAVPHMRKGRKA
ncbi:unnamed protein product [Callosobruchus maculatus]|uniref:Uncharacterized protein n=1 Tax=Callosobruchus maculatus TaxID=64391 RepID=A0A653BYG7_CALMS|nr:unnamed protein product [Callosobruchus maculatus]